MQAEAAIAVSHFAGKGPAQPFSISPEGERRFVVGLSWGTREFRDIDIHVPHLRDADGRYDVFYFFKLPFHLFRILVMSALKHAAPGLYQRGVVDYAARKRGISDGGRYDLDLSCYVFDASMHLQCVIGPEEGHYSDASKKVYHSGDDLHGSASAADDEQAFVETRGLPESYAHFFFVIETDGRYSLEETPHAIVRLADSRTNKDALKKEITPSGSSLLSHGYVFCHVFRESGGWSFRDVSEYHGFNADWVKVLKDLSRRA